MEQVTKLVGRWSGAASDNLISCSKLALDVFGAPGLHENSGMIINSYLYRRFGPTPHGSDDHKELCCYWLTTEDPDVVLTVSPKGLSLQYCFGYMATDRLRYGTTAEAKRIFAAKKAWDKKYEAWWIKQHPEHDMGNWKRKTPEERKAIKEAYANDYYSAMPKAVFKACGNIPRRDERPVSRRIKKALVGAMKELLRPVFIRDVAVNAVGYVRDAELTGDSVSASKYAGYGIDLKALDKVIEEEKKAREAARLA